MLSARRQGDPPLPTNRTAEEAMTLDGNQIWPRSTSTEKGTVSFTTPVKISLSR